MGSDTPVIVGPSGRACVCITWDLTVVSGNPWNVHLFGTLWLDTDGMHFFQRMIRTDQNDKEVWGWLRCNGLILPLWTLPLMVWVHTQGQNIPTMPPFISLECLVWKFHLKAHLLHLLNFFRATDHIFEVTEKEKKKNGEKNRKEKEKLHVHLNKITETGASPFQKELKKVCRLKFLKVRKPLKQVA